MRRVVVTGLGAVSPLGLDVASTWEAILAGKCGIEKITHFDASQFGAQIAGEVKGFEASDWLPAKEARRFDRFIAYACAAGMQALDDAQLTFSEENEEEANRAGCIIGSIVAPLGVAPLPHFAAIFVITLATLCCLRTWTMPREVRIGAAAPESGKRSFRPDLYLTLLGCIALGSMATEGAMYDWSSVYFAQVVQPGESLIRAGYLACMCAMVTGRLLADGLVNRFGVTPVLQLSGLCIAAGLSLALLWPDLLPATAGLALVGFGMASVVPLCYSLAGKSTRVPPSVAISLVSSLSFLGFLGCPPMVGFLSHQFDLRWALSPIVVVGVAIFCLAPLVRRIKA